MLKFIHFFSFLFLFHLKLKENSLACLNSTMVQHNCQKVILRLLKVCRSNFLKLFHTAIHYKIWLNMIKTNKQKNNNSCLTKALSSHRFSVSHNQHPNPMLCAETWQRRHLLGRREKRLLSHSKCLPSHWGNLHAVLRFEWSFLLLQSSDVGARESQPWRSCSACGSRPGTRCLDPATSHEEQPPLSSAGWKSNKHNHRYVAFRYCFLHRVFNSINKNAPVCHLDEFHWFQSRTWTGLPLACRGKHVQKPQQAKINNQIIS